MSDLLRDLGASVSALGSDWTKYSVVGSFLLYVFGYLAVRFHLTAVGIGTDLAVLDERYLFAGARFLVYLVSSIASVVLVLLVVACLLWLVRVLPAVARYLRRRGEDRPVALTTVGIVLAVFMIQVVMRQAFLLNDLLLARELPADPAWLTSLLFNNQLMPLYFDALVFMCGVSVAILLTIRKTEPLGLVGPSRALLAFLVAVQILLLPVNYGILIMDKVLPRVAGVASEPLADGDAAWLVWEGKDGVTFLVRHADRRRVLLTLPRADVKRMEIVGFDRIVPTLFGPTQLGGS